MRIHLEQFGTKLLRKSNHCLIRDLRLKRMLHLAGGWIVVLTGICSRLFCGLLVVVSCIAQVPESTGLPDTPQGRLVADYTKAFNSGDEKAMREFFANNVAASALEQRPIEARLEVYREMRGNMGAIDLRRVVSARDNEVIVLVQTKEREWRELTFILEPTPPHKLMGIRVQDADPPPTAGEAGKSTVTPPATMTEAQLVEAIDKHLSQAVAADEFSGTVLVAKKDSVVFQKAYGLASKEYNVPNRVDTKFNLGSINKIFTQIAIGQLVEQGKLSFDDKLGKYLPEFPNRDAVEKVTIRQLLDMKSGIGDFFGPEFEAMPKDRLRSLRDFLPLFATKPLEFEPGTKQQYSNGGYIVLGAIIEKVSGQDYYDYVREHIFKVAGMQNTDWYEADVLTANLASGYTREGMADREKSVRRNNIYTRPAKGSPAGGGYSTAVDLLKFVAALREGRLSLANFRQPAATDQQKSSEPKRAHFGGLGIAGGAPGINAALEANEASGYTIIVMSNYDPPSAEKIARQIRGWISRMKS
jgi:D-alanyl-D-alanine carboxypeptidase